MSRAELPFWVFTSGEEGVHGLDWGIKHASSAFTDRYELDARYRSLLRGFSLPPSLERPQNGVGLLLLPWQEGFLLGFLFPGNDHQGRPNLSAVVCTVTSDIARTLRPSEVVRDLWSANDLERIARPNAQRPDSFRLSWGPASSVTGPCPYVPTLNWPGKDRGYLMIDGSVRELEYLYPTSKGLTPKRKPRLPRYAASLLLLVLFGGLFACWGSIGKFFSEWLVQPICSFFGLGGNALDNPDSSEERLGTDDSEDVVEIRSILAIVKERLGTEDASEGLAGMVWIPDRIKREWDKNKDRFTFSEAVPADGDHTFLEDLKKEVTLTEHDNRHALVNVEDLSKELDKRLKQSGMTKLGIEEMGFTIKFKSSKNLNDAKAEIGKIIKINETAPKTTLKTQTNAFGGEEGLGRALTRLYKEVKEKNSFGYLAFFYAVEGEALYRLICINRDSRASRQVTEYLVLKGFPKLVLVDRDRLSKLLQGKETLKGGPSIEFNENRADIFFPIGKQDLLKEGMSSEKCIGVFLKQLLSSMNAGR